MKKEKREIMSEGRRTEVAVRSGEKRAETEVRRECVNKRV